MVSFPTRIPDCGSAPLDLFLFSDSSICFTVTFSLPWEVLIMLLSQLPLTFLQTKNGDAFIAQLMIILMLFGTVFVIIWDMFCERISFNSVLLLLVLNFMSVSRLELMYISLIVNIRSNFLLTFCQTQRDVLFHHRAYDCSRAVWDGLCDHLRDFLRKDIFKLSTTAAVSEFCGWVTLELMSIYLIVNIRSNLTH